MKSIPHQLLHSLLDYIREQDTDVDPKVFRLTGDKHFVRCRGDISGLPGVDFDVSVEGDHTWLRVARLVPSRPPTPPDGAGELLNIVTDPTGVPPTLNDAAVKACITAKLSVPSERDEDAPDPEAVATAVHAEANRILEAYSPRWHNWAEGERPRRTTMVLYGELFNIKHQLEAEETARPQEFVWGVGIATWKIPSDASTIPFEYPLLTQALEISRDEQTLALEVRPRTVDTRLEMDAFAACAVQGISETETAAKAHFKRAGASPLSPFDASTYGDILKLFAGNLDSCGQYREVQSGNERVPIPGPNLVVTDEWVLLTRPRRNNFLVDDLRRLQQRLKSGGEIPPGPLSLVSPPSDQPVQHTEVRFRGLSSRGNRGSGKPRDLYFPLPYNDEQVTIVQRLEQSPGITVQGPPGTGKTHTIANIICHYLASGKRILVTSRGEQALEVLQSKIPEAVRSLTVSLLATDREGVRQFQASIEAIQHQISQLNPALTQREIEEHQGAIDRAHDELAKIDRRVDDIAATQLVELDVDGTPLRAMRMAELAVSGESAHGWFNDAIDLDAKHTPPLSQEEAGLLRESRRLLQDDLGYVAATLPAPDALPGTDEVARLHGILARMRRIDTRVACGELIDLKAYSPEVLQSAQELLTTVDLALETMTTLDNVDGSWPLILRSKCRDATFKSEREALESLFYAVDALVEARAVFLRRPVEFPERGLGCVKTKEAVKRGAESGKPFGLFAFGAAEAKEHIAQVRIAGLEPQSQDDWSHVDRYLQLHQQVLSFAVRWNTFAADLALPMLEGGVSELRHIELVATAARKAHELATRHDPALVSQAQNVFQRPPLEALTSDAKALRSVREQLDDHLTKASLAQATVQLTTLQEKLAGKTGDIADALRDFLLCDLGNTERATEQVTARYAELRAELRRITGLGTHLRRVSEFAGRIERAGAPSLAQRVRTVAVDPAGEDPALPATWREAWNWARVRCHLEKIEARAELVQLFARRKDLELGLARLYQQLVAKSAWLWTKKNATHRVLQALAGYASAIRRIGQGTGPNAIRYRRDAREAMYEAAGAVPCWIMSHTRISEAMPPDIGAFDLVIVDEASQSDLWALPAILRGKKILVVGDDKQVSPDGGFIASTKIDELKSRFLKDQPYGTDMTPEKSLYDLAARVFAADQVMLREHFRCVPAIISYSNRTFYKDNIQPLRIPSTDERLDPPLVDIYVPHGLRDNRSCNVAEAEAIAVEIAAIIDSPVMAGRTLGVVSLLGMEQAKLIDTVVRQRCDPNELLRRRFDCGDARTFQGSERDVMFLSMVVDMKSCKALSGTMYDQRFNVAASRARDRMYLVRSVTTRDLSEKDLRLTLLNHFDKPIVGGTDLSQDLLDLCESGFEREVFRMLTERGYRVIPQVRAGAYRIDMVVEGAGDARLAIELDGDEFHGPDRWQYDMTRQRVLERAGWVFWRCFASTWSLNKEGVFAELVSRLTVMGIDPIGAVDKIPELVEKRTWVVPNSGQGDVAGDVLDEAIDQAKGGTGSTLPAHRKEFDDSPAVCQPEDIAKIVTKQEDAPSAQHDLPEGAPPTEIAYLLTVRQYDGGPWWTRAYPAPDVMDALRRVQGRLHSSVEQNPGVALGTRLEAVLNALVIEDVAPAADASHYEKEEAIRLATHATQAEGWQPVRIG